MKIDVDFNNEEQSALISFYPEEFKTKRDFLLAVNIVQTFSADFDLDPELGEEDIKTILSKLKDEDKNHLVFIINEEGIEVDLVDE